MAYGIRSTLTGLLGVRARHHALPLWPDLPREEEAGAVSQ
jgi:hypothetical protein